MTISQKELAEKLADAYDDSAHGFRCMEDEADFLRVARRAAELLGVELAPEKPEPGTWWINEENGDRYLCADEDDTTGQEAWCFQQGSGRPIPAFKVPWHKLTPARVVTTEPVELSEAEVGEVWDKRRIRIGNWGDLSTAKRVDITATVNAALREHGHGRAEVTREQVRDAIDDQVRWLGPQYAGEVADAVMPLLGGGNRG